MGVHTSDMQVALIVTVGQSLSPTRLANVTFPIVLANLSFSSQPACVFYPFRINSLITTFTISIEMTVKTYKNGPIEKRSDDPVARVKRYHCLFLHRLCGTCPVTYSSRVDELPSKKPEFQANANGRTGRFNNKTNALCQKHTTATSTPTIR